MNNAWDTFDKIVCIHYAKHTDRKISLTNELSRVGLLSEGYCGKLSFHTTAYSDSDKYIYDILKKDGISVPKTVGQFKAAFAHHEVLKCALAEGCDSILILENDIRFLNDVSLVHDIISPWRETERDLVMFDRFVWTDRLRPFVTKSGHKFIDFDVRVRGGSCYALSRDGIASAVSSFERRLLSGERKVYIGDMLYDHMYVRKCYSSECACIQQEYSDGMNLTVYGTHNFDVYRNNGVDISRYNIDK